MLPPNLIPNIIQFDSLTSTNAYAREIALKGGNLEGTVIVAKTQTAGRGRGSHIWHSPNGGLYFSILLYAKDRRRTTDLSILAGIAVAQAVKEVLPKSLDISVKWPNDCLVGWKKIAGILCESLGEKAGDICVVGVGINVNVERKELVSFEKNPFGVTSFKMENPGGSYDLNEVLQMTLSKLLNLYALYHDKGFQPIQFLWEKNCHFIGKKIELRESGWREEDIKTNVKEPMGITVGTVLGIDEDGALVLSNARGERRRYVSGEMTCFWP